MKKHGLIVADNGSDMYVSGAFDPRWDNGVLNPAFRGLNASDFEVIQLGWQGGGSTPPPACTPGAPTGLWATANGYNVSIGWTPPGGTVLGHMVDVGSASGLSNHGSLPIAAPAMGIAGPAPAGRYYLRARAGNACGAGPASNEVILDVPSGCSVPTAPGTFTSSVSGRMVTVGWGAAASAASYLFEVGSAPGQSNLVLSNVGGVLGLSGVAPPGVSYARVRGVSDCGQAGPASNERIVTVP